MNWPNRNICAADISALLDPTLREEAFTRKPPVSKDEIKVAESTNVHSVVN